MYKTAVLIPCLNEESTIGKVVSDFKAVLPTAKIFVYDNASTDNTAEEAQRAGAVVVYSPRKGKGNVVRQMLYEIDAECYILVDGDDTYPADKAVAMERLILQKKADMVIGDRLSASYFQQNTRRFHNLGNRLVRWCINNIFAVEIHDVMTGYRAFSYEFAKTFPILTAGFEIETEMTIHVADKRLKIEQIDIDYHERKSGCESKLKTFADGCKVLKTIAAMYRDYKPLSFFCIISIFLFILSTLFFIPVFVSFLNTGTVEKIPTLVVCCFVYTAALMSLFSGFILQSLRRRDLNDFEFRLMIAHHNRR